MTRIILNYRYLLITFFAVMVSGNILVLANPVQAQSVTDLENIKQQFIGQYELVSFIRYRADGSEDDAQYIGILRYDQFGNMSAQGMPKNLPEQAKANQQQSGGFAYWGGVSYDLSDNRVIHHVQGAPMNGSWVGQDNIRFFEFEDDLLKLSLKDGQGRITATLTWRRLD